MQAKNLVVWSPAFAFGVGFIFLIMEHTLYDTHGAIKLHINCDFEMVTIKIIDGNKEIFVEMDYDDDAVLLAKIILFANDSLKTV